MTFSSWVKLLTGFVVVFALFQTLGYFFQSDRGQAGVTIGIAVVSATLVFQILLRHTGLRKSIVGLGLGAPSARGIFASAGVSFLLLSIFPAYSIANGIDLVLSAQWLWSIPGLFFQAGIAEETLFRGYLFGNLREGRTFWRAAILSAIPFAVVHIFLFFTMPFLVAAAAFLLAVVMSFPFAYMFELGGRTIWAPALLHFVVQGAIKLVTMPDDALQSLAIVWMAACAIIPWCVFLIPQRAANVESAL